MVNMINPQQRSYVTFKAFIEDELPKIKDNLNVWSVFLDKSGNKSTPEFAKNAIKFGTDPLLFIADLNESYGFFHPDKPNTINIGRKLVDTFQANSGDLRVRQLIEATVLHELIHWSRNIKGLKEEEDGRKVEMGVKFEEEAYGSRILKDSDLIHALEEELGTLSRRFESKGDPKAIGWDNTGGWSYGLYQLASSKGQIANFINFLKLSENPTWNQFADNLIQAGGDPEARAGSPKFRVAWEKLAMDGKNLFSKAQHDYIKVTHYDKFFGNLINSDFRFDLNQHSNALRNVAWSVSVQHGPGAVNLFTIPITKLDTSQRSDDSAIINAIYDERSKVDIYFSKSTPEIKRNVLKRFVEERQDALRMLIA